MTVDMKMWGVLFYFVDGIAYIVDKFFQEIKSVFTRNMIMCYDTFRKGYI